MKTAKQIRQRLKEIEEDPRYQAPPALVHINAPLALIQCTLEGEHRGLKWVLEDE